MIKFIIPKFMEVYLEKEDSNKFKKLFEFIFNDIIYKEIFSIQKDLTLIQLNKVISKKINLKNQNDKNIFRYMNIWSAGICNDFGYRSYHGLIRSGKLKADHKNEVGYLIYTDNLNKKYIIEISPILYMDFNHPIDRIEFNINSISYNN